MLGERFVAEVAVTERTRRQAEHLKTLRVRYGLNKVALAGDLGFGSTQTYDLYERPKSVIRMDRIEDWANAFRLPALEFVSVVLFGDPDGDALWARIADMTDDAGVRAHMYRDLKPMTPDECDALLQDLAEHHPNLRKPQTDH